MDLVQTIFTQLRSDIEQKLAAAEKQIGLVLTTSKGLSQNDVESLIVKHVRALEARLSKDDDMPSPIPPFIEPRYSNTTYNPPPLPSESLRFGGLEGLLMRKPSEEFTLSTNMVFPAVKIESNLEVVEPDEEAELGQLAERQGGLHQEEEEDIEENVEEEDVEEEDVEEEEEEETLTLEEFLWKGKTYYKTADDTVYRANDEGEVEDEPFAHYDRKTERLVRLLDRSTVEALVRERRKAEGLRREAAARLVEADGLP